MTARQPYGRVDYIPPLWTKNLASGLLRLWRCHSVVTDHSARSHPLSAKSLLLLLYCTVLFDGVYHVLECFGALTETVVYKHYGKCLNEYRCFVSSRKSSNPYHFSFSIYVIYSNTLEHSSPHLPVYCMGRWVRLHCFFQMGILNMIQHFMHIY